jgi:regulation of enolase protein 1 (concanavalin A-like superfamily)
MNVDPEIRRLLEVMPASGRMQAKVVEQASQSQVIAYRQPQVPWSETPISINFQLWHRLARPQQDLLILRAVGWMKASNWLKLDLYQGVGIAGIVVTLVQLVQGDALGATVAAGLAAMSGVQIWRNRQSIKVELAADTEAVRVAQRRGYTETEAARHLLSAIQAVAELENRKTLEFTELIRSQNLRVVAGMSATAVPEDIRGA